MSRRYPILTVALRCIVLAALPAMAIAVWWPGSLIELARPQLLDQLNSTLAGEVRVESITTDGWSKFDLHDVTLSDPDGERVFHARSIQIEWVPLALRDRRLQIDALRIGDSSLRWHETSRGEIGFLEAIKTASSEPEQSDNRFTTLPIEITVAEIDSSHLDVLVDMAERKPLRRLLDIEGHTAIRRDLDIEATLNINAPEEHIAFTVNELSLVDPAGKIELEIALSAPLMSWLSHSDVNCDLSAQTKLSRQRESKQEPWLIQLDTQLGQSSLIATSRWSPSLHHELTEVEMNLSAPNACIPSVPSGALELNLKAEDPLEDLRVAMHATGDELQLGEHRLGTGAITASLTRTGDSLDANVSEFRWLHDDLRIIGEAHGLHIGTERVVVEEVQLVGGGARLNAKLDLDRHELLSPDSTAEINAVIPDLRRFDDLVGRELSGSIHTELELSGGVVPQTRGAYRVRELRVDGSPAVTIAGAVRTHERVVSLDGELTHTQHSVLPAIHFKAKLAEKTSRLIVDARNPDTLNANISIDADAGWKSIRQGRIAEATWRGRASSYGLKAELFQPWLTAFPDLTGTVNISATGAQVDGQSSAVVDIQLIDFIADSGIPPASGSIHLELDANIGAAQISIDHPVSISLAAELPAKRVLRPSLDAVLEDLALQLSLAPSPLETFSEFGPLASLRGTVGLDIDYRTGNADVSLNFSELRHRSFTPSLGGQILLQSQRGATRLEAQVLERLGGELIIRAGFPASADELMTSKQVLRSKHGQAMLIVDQLGIDRLLPTIDARARAAGALDAQVDIEGNLDDWSGQLAVGLMGGVWGKSVFRKFALSASVLDSKGSGQLEIDTVDHGKLVLRGQTTFDGSQPDQGSLKATDFSLEPFGEIANILGSSTLFGGRLDSDITLIADEEIRIDGEATLRDGSVDSGSIIPPIDDIDARLAFNGQNASIELGGNSGGGRITLTADGDNSIRPRVTGKLKVDDVPLNLERALFNTNFNVDIESTLSDDGLQNALTIRDSSIRVISLSDQSLHSSEELENVRYVNDEATAEDELNNGETPADSAETLQWTVSVNTEDPIAIEGKQLSASLESSLIVSSPNEGIQIDGSASIPRGEIELGPHRYTIERASITFRERTPINPRLNASFVKEFDEPPTSFYVRVRGTARAPSITFASNPNIYNQSDLASFFLGGRPGNGGEGLSGAGAAAALATVLTAPVQREIKKALPIDTLTIAPDEEVENGEALALTTGKWITPDLFVAYVLSVNTTNPQQDVGNTAILRYRVTPLWTLEMRVDPGSEPSSSTDLIWVKRF